MEALRRTCARFGRDFSPVPWRGGGLQGMHEFGTRLRNSLDCLIESRLVRQRGLIEAADLADELQGCCTDLAVCNGRRRIEQQFDVATHTSPVYFAGSARNYMTIASPRGARVRLAPLCMQPYRAPGTSI